MTDPSRRVYETLKRYKHMNGDVREWLHLMPILIHYGFVRGCWFPRVVASHYAWSVLPSPSNSE